MDQIIRSQISERYQRTLGRIASVATGCGRDPKSVQLVVVSKSQPLEVIQAAIAVGITTFGENYADEAIGKITALKGLSIDWHMIGHVQSRKADLVVEHFSMLHSLDNTRLAGRLERFCVESNKVLPVLLELNVSGEASKFGFTAWTDDDTGKLEQEVEKILGLPHLQICGLMTMPPLFDDPEKTRPYFQKLHFMQEFLAKRFPKTTWDQLSMGTSLDYVVAIQEGATIVRIGRAILGSRPI